MSKIKKTKEKKNKKKIPIKKTSLKKVLLKKNKIKSVKKNEPAPLRIANSNKYTPEEKVEIKKVKKQATEKRLYEIKDFIVYPRHVLGRL